MAHPSKAKSEQKGIKRYNPSSKELVFRKIDQVEKGKEKKGTASENDRAVTQDN